jgi:hypothetical protein
LTLVIQDDDSGGNLLSKTAFSAVGGTTYYIAVSGYSDARGNIRLNWQSAAAVPASATANTYHVFPQIADGRFGDGNYFRTTLMIANPSSVTAADCTFRLYGLTIDGRSSFTYSVGASGWQISQSSGVQNLKSGYATLECSANVEAEALYSLYSQNGTKISEAAVFSSPSASQVQILADHREGARLGLAIANDSDQSVNYSISVYEIDGRHVGTAPLTLAARSNRAAFLDELIRIPAGQYGPVIVSGLNGNARIIGLRFTEAIFTTIPQTIRSEIARTAASYHVFSQFADGRFSSGEYFRTTLMIANPSSKAGTTCAYRLFGLSIDGRNLFTYSLPAGGWLISTLSSTQAIKSGYSTLECSAGVEAQLLYSFYSQDGTKISEATVFSSPASAYTQILADTREGSRVGLAIANDSNQSVTYTIRRVTPPVTLSGQHR